MRNAGSGTKLSSGITDSTASTARAAETPAIRIGCAGDGRRRGRRGGKIGVDDGDLVAVAHPAQSVKQVRVEQRIDSPKHDGLPGFAFRPGRIAGLRRRHGAKWPAPASATVAALAERGRPRSASAPTKAPRLAGSGAKLSRPSRRAARARRRHWRRARCPRERVARSRERERLDLLEADPALVAPAGRRDRGAPSTRWTIAIGSREQRARRRSARRRRAAPRPRRSRASSASSASAARRARRASRSASRPSSARPPMSARRRGAGEARIGVGRILDEGDAAGMRQKATRSALATPSSGRAMRDAVARASPPPCRRGPRRPSRARGGTAPSPPDRRRDGRSRSRRRRSPARGRPAAGSAPRAPAPARGSTGFAPVQTSVACGTPSLRAERRDRLRLGRALRPQADDRRSRRRCARRAAPPIRRPSASSAVESGPPETAISGSRVASSGASSASTRAARERARRRRRSTMILGHLALGEPLHRRGRGRIAPAEFGEGRAGLLGVAERGQRLAEPHHALGRARTTWRSRSSPSDIARPPRAGATAGNRSRRHRRSRRASGGGPDWRP